MAGWGGMQQGQGTPSCCARPQLTSCGSSHSPCPPAVASVHSLRSRPGAEEQRSDCWTKQRGEGPAGSGGWRDVRSHLIPVHIAAAQMHLRGKQFTLAARNASPPGLLAAGQPPPLALRRTLLPTAAAAAEAARRHRCLPVSHCRPCAGVVQPAAQRCKGTARGSDREDC